uniref:Tudor domain-containing protein n=1 Tax=Sphenodon punctatus TaxID=8508 RepID=A0A8D0G619_SPHPU
MQQLFTALAQVEAKQPGLSGQEVQRGTRCMGECVLGDQEGAWNRCWVLDKVEDLAVVMFVDFGCSAAVPLSSLRRLDEDRFWAIKPLAHPFVLHDVAHPQVHPAGGVGGWRPQEALTTAGAGAAGFVTLRLRSKADALSCV